MTRVLASGTIVNGDSDSVNRKGIGFFGEPCHSCGCLGCCLIGGEYHPEHQTRQACESCTYECYEQIQTECDGTCPEGTTDGNFDLVSLEITGGCGYGASGTVTVGCGKIVSATVTSGGSGYAVMGREQPTLSLSVDGPGTDASLSASLTKLQDGCGYDYWTIDSIAINDAGSGYSSGDSVTISPASGDTVVEEGVATVVVDEAGSITDVTLTNGGWYYHENPSLPPYIDDVTVTIVQNPPSNGSGATVAATVDSDPSSQHFGEVVSLAVSGGGGSGYAELCVKTTVVDDCDHCPERSSPEYSSCAAVSGTCGTWTYPCCFSISDSKVTGDPPPGKDGVCDPHGPYLQTTVDVYNPCSGAAEVSIEGVVDDQLVVNGQLVGAACVGAGHVSHTFVTAEPTFSLEVMDNYWAIVAYGLTICFSCAEEEPPP